MLGGCDHCGEIADAVGIEVREVYNAMKRLDRRVAVVSRRMAD
jgi:DNA-binding CsgD family transcriptional regulator